MGLIVKLCFLLSCGTGWHDAIAAHYADGLFERVAARRGLPRAECYIASDWHDIGAFVLVYGQNTGRSLVCLVADVSAPKDRARHIRANQYELSFNAAAILCGSTKLRNDECPIKVSR